MDNTVLNIRMYLGIKIGNNIYYYWQINRQRCYTHKSDRRRRTY